jgi:hypothetical protein
MFTGAQATQGLNIGLHVAILFGFLALFFFLYLAKLERTTVQNELNSIVEDQTGTMLTTIDDWSTHSRPPVPINWKSIDDAAKKLEVNSQDETPEISRTNNKIRTVAVIVSVLLFVVVISAWLVAKFALKLDINTKRILYENLIIFCFIGLIEYLFYTEIAFKYIPTTPDLAAKTILDRVKSHLNKDLGQT